MRILLHADVDLSMPGGVETHVRELALELIERGHEVEVLARPPRFPPLTMTSSFTAGRHDVVHTHIGALPRGLDDHRTVQTLHLCAATKVEVYLGLGRLRTLFNPRNWREIGIERSACRASKRRRLIVVSERVRRDLSRWYGLDPAHAEVIPNGIHLDAPQESRAALRARHGLAEDTPVMLAIGREDHVKGFGLLARAWDRSRAAASGAVWVTVGRQRAERGPGRIVTGPVAHDEVRSWIGAADLGAFPSYYEGCGLAMLEMLAGGLYCLAHDVGIASEVIHAGNGRIVPRSTAAWTTAIDEALARRAKPTPPTLPPAYAWSRVVDSIERVYREVSESAAARA